MSQKSSRPKVNFGRQNQTARLHTYEAAILLDISFILQRDNIAVANPFAAFESGSGSRESNENSQTTNSLKIMVAANAFATDLSS